MRYPLIEGQGNFGSIDGDPPAAMRYTEARMAQIAAELLSDIEKDTVDFADNFDGSLEEPGVLPASLPNLLLNGATGIAVGMATSIPPHNLGEVCDALIYMLENWNQVDSISLEDLMKFIKGPDFPTGGILLRDASDDETDPLAAAYASGRGKVKLRGRAHLEEMSRGRSRIIITELPFQTNKSSLISRIADLAREGKLEGLADLRDESDRQGMRIVIELVKTADAETVLADLYRRTPLESTFSVIMLALVDGEPRTLTLRSALRVYLEHRMEVVRRRSEHDLAQARERLHILEGLRVALNNLDEVIEIIRSARDADAALSKLRKRFQLSEIQARAILDMRLRRLASLERKKIELEYKETVALIAQLEGLLKSKVKMRGLIAEELAAIKSRYSDRRRTQILQAGKGQVSSDMLTAKDMAPDKNTWVVVTAEGLVSRTTTARQPRISGRGTPQLIVEANVRDTLYLFTRQGVAAAVGVHVLPECEDPDEGRQLNSVVPLPANEPVIAGVTLPPDLKPDEGYLVTITSAGMVKKSALDTLPGPSARSFVAAKVADDDALGWVHITSGKDEMILVSSSGYAIRFSEDDVRPMGLNAAGVNGIRFESDEARLVGADIVRPRAELVLVTADGLAKRSALSQFPTQGRYGKGVLAWKSGDTVKLIGAAIGLAGDRCTAVLTKGANRTFKFGDAAKRARASAGVPLFELKAGSQVERLDNINSYKYFA